jgi:hypothetical protein
MRHASEAVANTGIARRMRIDVAHAKDDRGLASYLRHEENYALRVPGKSLIHNKSQSREP